jgi:predicted enzyme related to lactoylglutathione lyase
MASKVVHFEIMGPDGGALAAFYSDIFDWSPQATPGFDGYHMVSADETGVGGAVGQGNDEMPSYLTMYLEVEDIDAHLVNIEEAGGKTVAPRQEIPGMVTFALFSDPAGNLVGLVETEVPAAE